MSVTIEITLRTINPDPDIRVTIQLWAPEIMQHLVEAGPPESPKGLDFLSGVFSVPE
jgi:hypothetical protein